MISSAGIFLGLIACAAVAVGQDGQDPGSVATMQQRLAAYRHLLSDWAGLTRYGSEDSEIKPPAPGENRVVFIGDQITEFWGRGQTKFFPGKPYINRGIGGQTAPQMLVRFRQDVIALKPKVVVILAGSNDLAGVTGPATRGTLSDHVMSMTELAKAHGIRVVLASITPVCDCTGPQTDLRPPRRIAEVNEWLRRYAAESGSLYLDYYSALANGREFRKELTSDGLLPNDAGYQVMATLAEHAIAEALGSP
ncbi:MAG: SGNH/GDSL hydrolase family protein [Acidobacteriota bacterium]